MRFRYKPSEDEQRTYLERVATEAAGYTQSRFPMLTPQDMLMLATEELGELCRVELKFKGNEFRERFPNTTFTEERVAELGDVLMSLFAYAGMCRLSPSKAIDESVAKRQRRIEHETAATQSDASLAETDPVQLAVDDLLDRGVISPTEHADLLVRALAIKSCRPLCGEGAQG